MIFELFLGLELFKLGDPEGIIFVFQDSFLWEFDLCLTLQPLIYEKFLGFLPF